MPLRSDGNLRRGSASALEVAVRSEGGETRIELRGELSLASYDELERALRIADRDDASRIVIDLAGLTAIDSTGIGCMVHAVERAHEAGAEVAIVQGPKAVQGVFEMVGLADVLPFRSSRPPG